MSKLAAAAYVGGLVWFGLVLADVLARELASWLPGSAARADVELPPGVVGTQLSRRSSTSSRRTAASSPASRRWCHSRRSTVGPAHNRDATRF